MREGRRCSKTCETIFSNYCPLEVTPSSSGRELRTTQHDTKKWIACSIKICCTANLTGSYAYQ